MPDASGSGRPFNVVVADLVATWRQVEQSSIETATVMDERLGVLEAELLRCAGADAAGYTLQSVVLLSKAECCVPDDLAAMMRDKMRHLAALHLAGDARTLAERYVGPVNFSG